MAHEMGRLVSTASAEREEMVGAPADARRVGRPPIDRESTVGVVRAFSRLDIGEIDALARQLGPVDVPLVMRDIDSLEGIVSFRWMPAGGARLGSGVRNRDNRH